MTVASRWPEPPTSLSEPGDAVPKGGLRFSGETITGGSFALGQVLSFGSLDHVADHSSELHPLEETSSEDNESPAYVQWMERFAIDRETIAKMHLWVE